MIADMPQRLYWDKQTRRGYIISPFTTFNSYLYPDCLDLMSEVQFTYEKKFGSVGTLLSDIYISHVPNNILDGFKYIEEMNRDFGHKELIFKFLTPDEYREVILNGLEKYDWGGCLCISG